MKGLLKPKIHRRIEKTFKLKKGALKQSIDTLKTKHKFEDSDVLRIADECATYCIANDTDYIVSFAMYVSCLNNPKVEGTGV
jgi:hypothetical protein